MHSLLRCAKTLKKNLLASRSWKGNSSIPKCFLRRRVCRPSREHGALAKLAKKYRRFKDLNAEIRETSEMADGGDPELRELAVAELPELKEERERLWAELLDLTLGGEDAHRGRCVVESALGSAARRGPSSRDLCDMYRHYAEDHGWKVEILDMNPTELGGFKEIILGVEGEGCYRQLKYESGGHRVQRVPETEAKGRIHTSLATVAVMAEPEDVEIDLKPDDYRLDKFSASGPGGQHVNKTQSAVRLTHLATGIVVQCQDEKSQHKNLAKALRVLKTRLYEAKRQEEDATGQRTEEQGRLRRPQRTDPHVQFPRQPGHRPPHQLYPSQTRPRPGGEPRTGARGHEGNASDRNSGRGLKTTIRGWRSLKLGVDGLGS